MTVGVLKIRGCLRVLFNLLRLEGLVKQQQQKNLFVEVTLIEMLYFIGGIVERKGGSIQVEGMADKEG